MNNSINYRVIGGQMKNTYLIERKETIFSKIKKWFHGIFKKNIIQEETNSNIETTQNTENMNNNIEKIDNSIKTYEEDKERFMEVYNKVKNREIDFDTLDEETIEKICQLLKEEIHMKNKIIDDKYKKIIEFNNDAENTDL